MATLNGVAATNAAKTIPVLIEEGQKGGKVRKMYDIYTLLADLAVNDVINMGVPLPEGARLVDCKLTTGALGGSCALSVGWPVSADLAQTGGGTVQAADVTAFFNAFVVSSAQRVSAFGQSVAAGGSGDFYQTILTSQVQVQVKCTAVSSSATGKTIQVEVDYVIE